MGNSRSAFLREYRTAETKGKVEHPLHTLSTFFPRSLGGQARKVWNVRMNAYVVPLSKAAQEFGPKPDVYVYWRPAQEKGSYTFGALHNSLLIKRVRNQNKVVQII